MREFDGEEINGNAVVDSGDVSQMVAMSQALHQMAERYPRLGRVVELRYLNGLSVQDVAATLGVDARTVKRDWRKARNFIGLRLG